MAAGGRKLRTAAWTDHHGAGQPQGSKTIDAVTIHIGPLVFDHADYDAHGDVLYLHVGAPQTGEGDDADCERGDAYCVPLQPSDIQGSVNVSSFMRNPAWSFG